MSSPASDAASGGESVRARLFLARMNDDEEPVVVGAIDQTVWDHWDEEDEREWVKSCIDSWGMAHGQFVQVWATFAPDDLLRAYDVPVIEGGIEHV